MEATLEFDSLRAHAARLGSTSLARLDADDPARATDFALRAGPVYANFARQRYDRAALAELFALAERAGVPAALRALFEGVPVNVTERRPALHTALRGDLVQAQIAGDARRQVLSAIEQMGEMLAALQDSPVTDIVSVGIGGSDLGPRLVVDALSGPTPGRFRVHFLSNVDGAAAQRALAMLDPKRTAAILISKSFGTQETLLNGAILREWLKDDSRLFAVSANVDRAVAFGVDPTRILPMWDWIGGRYSLWSAVGFPIAVALGMDGFRQLLAGAEAMDAHVLHSPPQRNIALWHALTAVWNRNGLGLGSHAVFPYDERLKLLPAHLQQLVMESLGKSTRLDGTPVAEATVPVWWGGAGTDVQHSFFQSLHQGCEVVSSDFIGVLRPDHSYVDNHRVLLAHMLAQTEALAHGQGDEDPHRAYPGNRPSTVFLLDALTPAALGGLIAMYEHSVYVQSVLWNINAFDQFGVELGKQVAERLLPAIRGSDRETGGTVTRALLDEILRDR